MKDYGHLGNKYYQDLSGSHLEQLWEDVTRGRNTEKWGLEEAEYWEEKGGKSAVGIQESHRTHLTCLSGQEDCALGVGKL